MVEVDDCLNFATAFEGNDRCPRTLKLAFNDLKDDGAIIISRFLSQFPSLTSLDLGFNSIGDAGTEALATSLAVNSTLKVLHLSGNAITANGFMFLSKAIQVNDSLLSLHLTGNSGNIEGAAALAESLNFNTSLEVLSLNGNNVKEHGAYCVGDMLKTNRTLTHLNLSDNGIGDYGIAAVADALHVNSNLKNLEFSFNEITFVGIKSLCESVQGYTTLSRLLLDNNRMGVKGAMLLSEILPSLNLNELNIGFNEIEADGLSCVVKSLIANKTLESLTLSGNSIDVDVSRLIAYMLAHNTILKELYLDRTNMDTRCEKNIAAGLASSKSCTLRTLTGFSLGPVLTALGSPALESLSNDRVLKFLSEMWASQKEAEKHHRIRKVRDRDSGDATVLSPSDLSCDDGQHIKEVTRSRTPDCSKGAILRVTSEHSSLAGRSAEGRLVSGNNLSASASHALPSSKSCDMTEKLHKDSCLLNAPKESVSAQFDGYCEDDMKKIFSFAGICSAESTTNKENESGLSDFSSPEEGYCSAEALLYLVDSALSDPAVVCALNLDLRNYYGRSVSCSGLSTYTHSADSAYFTRQKSANHKRKLYSAGALSSFSDLTKNNFSLIESNPAGARRSSSSNQLESFVDKNDFPTAFPLASVVTKSTSSTCLGPRSTFLSASASCRSLDILKRRKLAID